MPIRPPTPCTYPGCPRRAVQHGRCAAHARQARRQCDQARASAALRGYGSAWRRLRAAYLAQHPYCVVCGAPGTDVDHITPRSQGGTDDPANLETLCHRHHSRKTAARDGGFGNRGAP